MIGVGPVEIELDPWERTFGIVTPLYGFRGRTVYGVAIIDGVWVRGPVPLPSHIDAPSLPPDGPWLLDVVLRGKMWHTPPQAPKPKGSGIPGLLLGYYHMPAGKRLEDLTATTIVQRLLPRPCVETWLKASIRGGTVDFVVSEALGVSEKEYRHRWAPAIWRWDS